MTGRRTCEFLSLVYKTALFRSVRKTRNFSTPHAEGSPGAVMKLHSRVLRSELEPVSTRETRVTGCGIRNNGGVFASTSSSWEGAHGFGMPAHSWFGRTRRHQTLTSFAHGGRRGHAFSAGTRNGPSSSPKGFRTPGAHPIAPFGASTRAFSNRDDSIITGPAEGRRQASVRWRKTALTRPKPEVEGNRAPGL